MLVSAVRFCLWALTLLPEVGASPRSRGVPEVAGLAARRQARAVQLRIVSPPPGWFLYDARLTVEVADRTVYDGSFMSGFDVKTDVPVRPLVIQTAVFFPGTKLARKQQIPIDLTPEGGFRDAGAVHVEISYSRFWGNFKKKASISARAPS